MNYRKNIKEALKVARQAVREGDLVLANAMIWCARENAERLRLAETISAVTVLI